MNRVWGELHEIPAQDLLLYLYFNFTISSRNFFMSIYIYIYIFFFEELYFQENFIWKTSILKTRTIKSLKEEEIPSGTIYIYCSAYLYYILNYKKLFPIPRALMGLYKNSVLLKAVFHWGNTEKCCMQQKNVLCNFQHIMLNATCAFLLN